VEPVLPAEHIVELGRVGLAPHFDDQTAPVGSETGRGERMGMLDPIAGQH
jgi:hypothetical protein